MRSVSGVILDHRKSTLARGSANGVRNGLVSYRSHLAPPSGRPCTQTGTSRTKRPCLLRSLPLSPIAVFTQPGTQPYMPPGSLRDWALITEGGGGGGYKMIAGPKRPPSQDKVKRFVHPPPPLKGQTLFPTPPPSPFSMAKFQC